ncbi:MAG: HU family DNA-binding protein [Hydrotalea sp.]|nr:HU family DNA-binding protein [Hydrotalea sp.]
MAIKKTIVKKDIAMAVAVKNNLSVLRCEKILDDMMNSIISELAAGHGVKLAGFGSFSLRDKAARPGRNPKTREVVTVAARRVVLFKVGTYIRGSLRERTPSKKMMTATKIEQTEQAQQQKLG